MPSLPPLHSTLNPRAQPVVPASSTSTSLAAGLDPSNVTTRRLVGHRAHVRCLACQLLILTSPSLAAAHSCPRAVARPRMTTGNADGRRLASGSVDKSLRVWIPEKGAPDAPLASDVVPGRLATDSVEMGADIKTSVEYRGHEGDVSCVRWNPTHLERLASSSSTRKSAITTRRQIYIVLIHIIHNFCSWRQELAFLVSVQATASAAMARPS